MNVTVASFWAGDPLYRTGADRLRRQCEALGIGCYIVARPHMGWLANTRQKPRHILEAQDATGGPVLWIDADGGLYGLPSALDPAYDVMAVAKRGGLYVGVIYFGVGARDLLTAWRDACEAPDETGGDDTIFNRLSLAGVRVGLLPPTYHAIGEPSRGDVAGIRLARTPEKLAYHRRAG